MRMWTPGPVHRRFVCWDTRRASHGRGAGVGEPRAVVLVLLFAVGAASCGSGSASGPKGEHFASQSSPNASSPIPTGGQAPVSRVAVSAVVGSYDITITLASGANADKCRNTGVVHETVAVQDQPGDRPLTMTNDVPDAAGQKQVEAGALHDDGSWDATGTYARAGGSATYTWHGTFPGDGSMAGTYTGTTPYATCTWRFTAHRK
jgi:hypothetical protein